MWCPKCKNEYVEGITVCADCGCELLETLTEEENVTEKFETEAVSFSEEEISEIRAMVKGGVYHKAADKAKDFTSSAYALLIVGAAGVILTVLLLLEKLPLRLFGANKYMIGGVLGVMFLAFIIMGIQSLKSAKELAKKAEEEEALTEEILAFCRSNLSKETIDTGIFSEDEADITEEEKYFKRAEKIQERIMEQFEDLEEDYAAQVVDGYYQEVFSAE